MRRAYPDTSAIWRREWAERQSGEFVGVSFPHHYHLLFFGLPFVHHEALNETWRQVIGADGLPRTEIKGIANWRQAVVLWPSTWQRRRPRTRRGTRAAGPTRPGLPVLLSMAQYRTGQGQGQDERPQSIGRCWGVFNRKRLPSGRA